jgi:hypothetical protein
MRFTSVQELEQWESQCAAIGAQHEGTAGNACRLIPREDHSPPFTVLVSRSVLETNSGGGSATATDSSSSCGDADGSGIQSSIGGSEEGSSHSDHNSSNAPISLALQEHVLTAPMWRQLPVMVCFECDRNVAKELAKQLTESLLKGTAGGMRGGR